MSQKGIMTATTYRGIRMSQLISQAVRALAGLASVVVMGRMVMKGM